MRTSILCVELLGQELSLMKEWQNTLTCGTGMRSEWTCRMKYWFNDF